jgi:competence ComEA-like helix-hairpin-helix protein
MFNFTPEERRVTLFLLGLAFCGVILSSLIKANCQFSGVVYPRIHLAKLNLNQVNLEELAKVKAVPWQLARRIIEFRDFHKEFDSLEELKSVKGIGKQRFEKLKEIFFVE